MNDISPVVVDDIFSRVEALICGHPDLAAFSDIGVFLLVQVPSEEAGTDNCVAVSNLSPQDLAGILRKALAQANADVRNDWGNSVTGRNEA